LYLGFSETVFFSNFIGRLLPSGVGDRSSRDFNGQKFQGLNLLDVLTRRKTHEEMFLIRYWRSTLRTFLDEQITEG
jgi:hypothetical protein